MMSLLAQAQTTFQRVAGSIYLGVLLCLPFLLVIMLFLLARLFRQARRTRAHIQRAEQHMDQVESLLTEIATNTRKD